jgi:predicted amidohydrolase YtcJ
MHMIRQLFLAYLLGQDDKEGPIRSGKFADFTILDRNPLAVSSPDELKDIKALGTVIGGKAFPASGIR